MKTYEIVVNGLKVEDEEKEISKIKGVHKISTLEEYFSLLTKISELTDGEYRVYNCGTYIVIWE